MSSMICATRAAAQIARPHARGGIEPGCGPGVPAESVDLLGRRFRLERTGRAAQPLRPPHRRHRRDPASPRQPPRARRAAPAHPVHGWPSSFLEMLPFVDQLGGRVDLVTPALPGYAFSSRPQRAVSFGHTSPSTAIGSSTSWAIAVRRVRCQLGRRSGHPHGAVPSGQPCRHTPQHGRDQTLHRARHSAPFAGGAFIAQPRRCLGQRRARLQLCAIHPSTDARISRSADSPTSLAAWVLDNSRS